MTRDDSVLVSICDPDCLTIKRPESIREKLINYKEFIAHDDFSKQLQLIVDTGSHLLDQCDIIRFLSLNTDKADCYDFGEKLHLQIVTSLSELYYQYENIKVSNSTAREIQKELLNLIGIIFSAGICISSLKKILKMSTSNSSDLALQCNALKSFFHAVMLSSKSTNPNSYFSFGGKGSGIKTKGVGKWPFPSEYFMYFNFRIEQYCNVFNIIHFASAENHGLKIILTGDDLIGYTIVVEVSDERKKAIQRVALSKNHFKSRVWYRLTIHHYSRRFGTAEIRFTLNSIDLGKFSLHFPSRIKSPITTSILFQDFNGQLSSVYLFKDAPNAGVLQSLIKSDELYENAMKGIGLKAASQTGLYYSETGLTKTFANMVYLSYNARRCIGSLCLDLYKSHNGTLLANAVPWCLLSLQDGIRCHGGIKALIPLLWQHQAMDEIKTNQQITLVSECLIASLNFIASLLLNNSMNQTELLQCKGADLITAALSNIPPAIKRCVCNCVEITRNNEKKHPMVSAVLLLIDACKESRELHHTLVKSLLFDFTIWHCNGVLSSSTSKSMHMQLLELLHARTVARPSEYACSVGMQHLLDGLRSLYADTFDTELKEEDSVAFVAELNESRQKARLVMSMAHYMLSKELHEDELKCVISGAISAIHLAESSNSSTEFSSPVLELSHDCLLLLLLLLQQVQPPKNLYPLCHSLCDGQGLASVLIINLIGCDSVNERVRAMALRTISVYLARVDCHLALQRSSWVSSNKQMQLNAIDNFASLGGYSYIWRALSNSSFHNVRRFSQPHILLRQNSSLTNLSHSPRAFASHPSTRRPLSPRFNQTAPSAAYKASESTYNALLNMLVMPLDKEGLTPSELREFYGDDSIGDEQGLLLPSASPVNGYTDSPTLILDDTQMIQNKHVLHVLLQILPYMGLYMQQKAFQDLFLLLKFQARNRHTFIHVPGWQASLLVILTGLLPETLHDNFLIVTKNLFHNQSANGDNESNEEVGMNVCFDMGVKLFILLLFDDYNTNRQNWKQIELILSLRPLSVVGSKVTRFIIYRFLGTIRDYFLKNFRENEEYIATLDSTSPCIINLLHLSMYIEHVIFEENPLVEIDRVQTRLKQQHKKHVVPDGDAEPADGASVGSEEDEEVAKDIASLPIITSLMDIFDKLLWKSNQLSNYILKFSLNQRSLRGCMLFVLIRLSLFSLVNGLPYDRVNILHSYRLFKLTRYLIRFSKGTNSSLFSNSIQNLLAAAESDQGEESVDDTKDPNIFQSWILVILVEVHSVIKDIREFLFHKDERLKMEGDKEQRYASNACTLSSSLLDLLVILFNNCEDYLKVALVAEDSGSMKEFVQLYGKYSKFNGAGNEAGSEGSQALNYEKTIEWLFHPFLLLPLNSAFIVKSLNKIGNINKDIDGYLKACMASSWDEYLQEQREASDTQKRATLELSVSSYEQNLSYMEYNRLAVVTGQKQDDRREIAHQWKLITLESMNQMYINEEAAVHLMVSDREDYLRRRILLKFNHNFDPHLDAVYHNNLDSTTLTEETEEMMGRIEETTVEVAAICLDDDDGLKPAAEDGDAVAVGKEVETTFGKGTIRRLRAADSVYEVELTQWKLTGPSLALLYLPVGNSDSYTIVDAPVHEKSSSLSLGVVQTVPVKPLLTRQDSRSNQLQRTNSSVDSSPLASRPVPLRLLKSTSFREGSTGGSNSHFKSSFSSSSSVLLTPGHKHRTSLSTPYALVKQLSASSLNNDNVYDVLTDLGVRAKIDPSKDVDAADKGSEEFGIDCMDDIAGSDSLGEGYGRSHSQSQNSLFSVASTVRTHETEDSDLDSQVDSAAPKEEKLHRRLLQQRMAAQETCSDSEGESQTAVPGEVKTKIDDNLRRRFLRRRTTGASTTGASTTGSAVEVSSVASLEVNLEAAAVDPSAEPTPDEAIQTFPDKRHRSNYSIAGSIHDVLDEWIGDCKLDALNERQYTLLSGEELVHVSNGARFITPLAITAGRVEVSTLHIFFYADIYSSVSGDENGDIDWYAPGNTGGTKSRSSSNEQHPQHALPSQPMMMRWKLVDLIEIHSRRYLLRKTALEFFFKDMTNVFIDFATPATYRSCYRAIMKQPTPSLERAFTGSLTPSSTFERSHICEQWRNGEMTNFEYLIKLNTIAGRSYNDITQYPIFPWILTDYTSDTIDLSDPSVYRDLSKPVGALNPTRLEEFIERFESFDDGMEIPPFHYGSHYSSAGVLLHYLVRLEPFTSLAIELQGGRFDCPDRLFFSVADCWNSCLESMSDVKELIPEFFYCPEMFMNLDHFSFGARQDCHEQVNEVELPPWAKTAHDFVRINREALESDYVSANLHHWIDLVFGYKQIGQPAVDSHNVFYYLTYEGAVDLDSIEDPLRRKSIETQIAHFGQTPSQLLSKPHPPKKLFESQGRSEGGIKYWSQLTWTQPKLLTAESSIANTLANKLFDITKPPPVVQTPPLISICAYSDRLVVIHEDLSFGVHRWSTNDSFDPKSNDTAAPYIIRMLPSKVLASAALSVSVRARPKDVALVDTVIGNTQMRVNTKCFTSTANGKLIVSCNYFDNSLRINHVDNVKVEYGLIGHCQRVTCLAKSDDGETIVTGSDDCCLILWTVNTSHDTKDEMLDLFGAPDLALSNRDYMKETALLLQMQRLIGHSTAVQSVDVSSKLGIVLSGSLNGVGLIHTLHDGMVLHTLKAHGDYCHCSIDLCKIASLSGFVILYYKDCQYLAVYSINSSFLVDSKSEEAINDMVVASHKGKEFIFTACADGSIVIRKLDGLAVLHSIHVSERPLRCVALTADQTFILAGTEDGKLIAVQQCAF